MPLDPATLNSLINNIQRNFSAGQSGAMGIARARLLKWADAIYRAVKSQLVLLYMPSTPVVYQRTGRLLKGAELVMGGTGSTPKATIRFERRSTSSFFAGGHGLADLMTNLDQGYSVKADVWWKNRAYMGYRNKIGILEEVAARYQAAAAADGVTVTYH